MGGRNIVTYLERSQEVYKWYASLFNLFYLQEISDLNVLRDQNCIEFPPLSRVSVSGWTFPLGVQDSPTFD